MERAIVGKGGRLFCFLDIVSSRDQHLQEDIGVP